MKTLIVYTSKHGSTMRAAKRVASNVSNFDLIDLQSKEVIEFELYDTIYIGTPIYFGKISKQVSKFISKNKSTLLEKTLKIFTLGLDDKNLKKTIKKSFDEDLLSHAHHIHFGGAYLFEEMSFLERFIVKKVARFTESVSMIDESKVIELVNM
jgi:menaquinone-dependent protoporphyrinogen oxidase